MRLALEIKVKIVVASVFRRVIDSQLPRLNKLIPQETKSYLKSAFPTAAAMATGTGSAWQRISPNKDWRVTIDWVHVSEDPDAIAISGHFLCKTAESNHEVFVNGKAVQCRTHRPDVVSLLGTEFPFRTKQAGFVHVLPYTKQKTIQLEIRSQSGEAISTDAIRVREVNPPMHRNAQYKWYFPLSDRLDHRTLLTIDEPIKFSIVVPVYNVSIEYLNECVNSVMAQSYTNWELCLCDDKSTRVDTIGYLRTLQNSDPRIKVLFSEENQNISGASNSAVSMATGDFVGLLDHDDVLHPHALHHNAVAIMGDPEIDVLYSDEDKLELTGERTEPYFKPQYSRELLLANNYITHFLVFRRSLGDQVGWFRLGYEGSQDHDLVLRLVEKARKIHHIPKILYHWRKIEGSTALAGDEKSYAWDAGVKAVEEALERRGVPADVEYGEWRGSYKVSYSFDERPKISIVIPFRDQVDFLRTAMTSIFDKTEWEDFEILLVDNGSSQPETLDYLKLYDNVDEVKVLSFDEPFNYSRINNFAIEQSAGEVILMLNNDIQVITPGWLTRMYGFLQQDSVGAVGAHLLYDDDTNQHNGVVLGIGGVAGHALKGMIAEENHYYLDALPRNVSACTAACLMVSKADWAAVGGLNEDDLSVAFNDVDFCLKVGALGKEIIFAWDVKLYHFESKSRGYEDTPEKIARFEKETAYMKKNWSALLNDDPFYNPNLTRKRQDFSLNVERLLAACVENY